MSGLINGTTLKTPISLIEFQNKLALFLNEYLKIHVVADWAEDLSLFTRSLIISEGRAIRIPPLTMELWTGEMCFSSEIPHNALSDARVLADSYRLQLRC